MKNSKFFTLSRLMLLLLVAFALTLAMVSCGDDEGTDAPDAGGTSSTIAPAGSSGTGTTGSSGTGTTDSSSGAPGSNDIACVHTFNEGTVQVEATCINGGTVIKACTKCGYETAVATPKLDHSYVKKTVEPTCTENGADVYTCSVCKDSYSDVTALATGHNTTGCTWESAEVLQAGCNWMHIESTTCSACSKKVEHISYYEKHDFETAITTSPTCVSEGVKTSTCKTCKATETVNFTDANAHTWNDGSASPTNASITNYSCLNTGCTATKSVFSAKDQISASVPSDALQSAGAVELQNATVKLDQSTIDQLGDSDITISADKVGNGDISDILDKLSEAERAKLNSTTVFDFTLNQGDNAISQFDGKVTVTVPYTLEEGADPDNIAVWYIKEDGTLDSIMATYTVVNGEGYAVFETNHFSYYSVVRMSVEERCALYGHKYNKEIVPPACNQEGYTIKTCVYCKKVEPRTNFVAALTHKYETSVVAPSCGVKGYTLNKCTLCKDSYNTNYVDELTHNYEQTVVAPTCKSSGYTLNTCTICADSYKSDETGIVDHSYKDSKCTMCGKAQEKAGNTFLTMIDSISGAGSYLLEANNVVFTELVEGMDFNYVINKLKAYVSINSEGYLVGDGVASISLTLKESGEVEIVNTTSKVVFVNNKVYIYTDGVDSMMDNEENGSFGESYPSHDGGPIYSNKGNNSMVIKYPVDVNDDMFAVLPQDAILSLLSRGMPTNNYVAMITDILGKLGTVWQDMLGAKDSAVEDALVRLVNLVFTKKEVNGGYTYTLNPTFAKVVFNRLKTDSLNMVFESVFGKGSYAEALDFATRALEMTVPEIKAELEGELAKSGIIAATIYAILAEYEIDVDGMVAQYGDSKLYEILNNMTENPEGTVDSYKEKINGIDQMMKETTALNILEQQTGTEYPEDDPYGAMIDEVIKILDKMTFSFSTAKEGEFISSSIIFNNFIVDTEIEGDQLKVTANGAFSFTVNTPYVPENNDQLIEDCKDIEDATNFGESIYTDDFAIFTYNGLTYVVAYTGMNGRLSTMFTAPTVDFVEETFNGVPCIKYSGVVSNFYVLDSGLLSFASHSCEGWLRIATNASYYTIYNGVLTEAELWVDANGKLIGMNVENIEKLNSSSDEFSFYYAPETKEYKGTSSHNFKIVEDVRPDGCEYGVRTFRCTICGATDKTTYGQGHTWQQVATLNQGSVSCKDGVTITRACSACGITDESFSWKTNDHYQVRKTKLYKGTTACGDTYTVYNECACGTYANFIGTISDHAISYDSYYDDHTSRTWSRFTCTVEGCGFTYYYRSTYTTKYEELPEGTCWDVSFEEVMIGDETLTFNHERRLYHPEEHDYSDDNSFVSVKCRLCQKQLWEARYDEHRRQIYYKNFIEDYYWNRVFTGCDYIQTYSDGEERPGTEHLWTHVNVRNASCTQYGEAYSKCTLCGFEENHYFVSPYDRYWYDGMNNSHDWEETGTGTYRCSNCGTESTYGASGLITLEDMTDSGEFKIGYFNGLVLDIAEINIIFNYQLDGNGIELENSESYYERVDTTPYEYGGYQGRTSGTVKVNMSRLNEAINANGDVQTVSVVFWMALDSQTEEGETFFQAYALTFTLDELATLN